MVRLNHYFLVNIIQRLFAVVVQGVTGIGDKLSWQGIPNGEFSVRTVTYSLLTLDMEHRSCIANYYKWIWNVLAPERVRVFLQLVSHQVIMTNVERFRRHIRESEICQVCKAASETIIHLLRDCPDGWYLEEVGASTATTCFFTKSLLEWLFENLSTGGSTSE